MTPIERPCAIHSIDHYMLGVPDLTPAKHFFESFGLAVDASDDRVLLRTDGSDHVWGCLIAAPHKQLASLTLNCYAGDYDELVSRISALAAVAVPHPRALHADGYWFHDPDGNLLQLRVGPKTTVNEKIAAKVTPRSEVRGVAGRETVVQVRPNRLSHVLLFASDVTCQLAFYRDALGLQLSDESAGIVAFMHAPHGSDHHLMAFVKSSHRGWHHASWDVAAVEDVGMGWMQMQSAGYSHVWGPGRHVLGSNYFCYVQDPWGSWCEYSADMDYVSAGQQWPAADHAPEDSLYLWGPPPPPDFVSNDDTPA